MKTKETKPTRPGSPTPCKQALSFRSRVAAFIIQVKITKKDKHRNATGWPRPLSRGGHLMQVTIKRLYERNIGTFTGCFIKGGRLIPGVYIQVRLYLF